ncbi:carboxypeptidase-like regulatory domain-containing protein [Hydrotalea flava]|uniref:carboxypeptidase-like regulatory domain-containing protein n=1 Tax=Hydrotalea flava TaxID=714549 RepID=UPI00142ECBEC|nr:carboxypeptidase-like regulatory domain-containing protein [Hydrotalea flava]
MRWMNCIKTICFVLMSIFSTQLSFAHNEDKGGGVISGKIITADNEPSEGVTVHLRNKNKNKNRTTVTNENGFFKFSGVAIGNYIIEISFVGYETIHQKILIEEGARLSLSYQ